MTMSNIINLLHFRMSRLHLDQDFLANNVADQPATAEAGYDILANKEVQDQYLMILTIKGSMGAEKGRFLGPAFEAVGVAEFRVPSDLTAENKIALVAFNGGAILYGLIRGQLALITGCFPSGSVLLPTLDWQETVKEIEKKRAGTRQGASQEAKIKKNASVVPGKAGTQEQAPGAERKTAAKKRLRIAPRKTAGKSKK